MNKILNKLLSITDCLLVLVRVLEPFGTLIFKWNENQITVSQILKAIGKEPLFGHKSGKLSNTHWMSFMKGVSCN